MLEGRTYFEQLAMANDEMAALAESQRRFRLIKFPAGGLAELLSTRTKVSKGIPEGGRVVAVHYCPVEDSLWIRVCHPGFEPVPVAHAIPQDLCLTVSRMN